MRIRRLPGWLLLSIILALAVFQFAVAQSGNLSGLVIDFGSGETAEYCFETGADSLTGYDVLLLAGLPVAADHTPQGSAVCKIGAVGCPIEDCFCDSPPNYWSYWHLQDGAWVYATLGSSVYQVKSGSVDAWTWGDGSPPPVRSLEQLCGNPDTIRLPASGNQSKSPLEASKPSSSPMNYLLFGILAAALGVGLIWMVSRR